MRKIDNGREKTGNEKRKREDGKNRTQQRMSKAIIREGKGEGNE